MVFSRIWFVNTQSVFARLRLPHCPDQFRLATLARMVCPHCEHAFHDSWTDNASFESPAGIARVQSTICARCGNFIIRLSTWYVTDERESQPRQQLLYPRRAPREPPPEVGAPFSTDYREASLVLESSPKASAALSRRLLQHVLREKAGIKRRNLDEEIQAVIDEGVLPSDLANDLDALRTVGNFAAHSTKSTNTGEVVEVEAGESEWLLNLLDELFDFYFVRPAPRAKQREHLNAKLADAGKPPLKGEG